MQVYFLPSVESVRGSEEGMGDENVAPTEV